MSGHLVPTSGSVEVFGLDPYENDTVTSRICLAREGQQYPDSFRVRHVVNAIGILYPRADMDLAHRLVADFDLPTDRKVKGLSRGMRTALAAVIGLASRAPLTLLVEPFLGLDAVTRRIFYDHLLADYAEHPRTIVLSTHLIDEVSELVEQVVVIDRGRLLLDAPLDALRQDALTVSGPRAAVRELADRFTVLSHQELAGTVRSVIRGVADSSARDDARRLGIEARPVTLQELFVALTTPTTTATMTTTAITHEEQQ
jgi:ABC-2 type transport system ATP-binding protein